MAFGQQSGPPASPRQVQELLRLLREAGHVDFRDARGPMGFNQRQAAGKFTRDEAVALIEQLESAESPPPDPRPRPAPRPRRPSPPAAPTATTAAPINLHDLDDRALANELERRGWIVIAP